MKPETKFDTTLVFLFILPVILLLLSENKVCQGWDARSMNGACSISFLTPLYNFFFGMMISSFPLIIIGALSLQAYIESSKIKMQKLRVGGMRSLFENPIGLIIWTITTLFIICPIIYVSYLFYTIPS